MCAKWPFWKHCAPKMRLVEAQCAHRKHCYTETPLGSHPRSQVSQNLSGPLNRLNAIPSLLHPLDGYRTPSAIGSAIGRPYLALSRFRAQLGVLNRLVLTA